MFCRYVIGLAEKHLKTAAELHHIFWLLTIVVVTVIAADQPQLRRAESEYFSMVGGISGVG